MTWKLLEWIPTSLPYPYPYPYPNPIPHSANHHSALSPSSIVPQKLRLHNKVVHPITLFMKKDAKAKTYSF